MDHGAPEVGTEPHLPTSVWPTMRPEPAVAPIHGLGVYPANLCRLSCLVELASLGENFG
jgi:hypothetical protein